jgi:hypothetical protein
MPSHRSVAVIVPPRESRHGDHPRKGIGRHDVGAAGLAPRHGGFVLVDGAADAGGSRHNLLSRRAAANTSPLPTEL